jgi:hypothetical protein
MPFSRDEFLDVFAAYNAAYWPLAAALWIASAAVVIAVAFGRDRSRWAIGLLAFQWGWAAAAYHGALFSRINPAALLFAAGFAGEAALLLWYGPIRGAIAVVQGSRTVGTIAGYAFLMYGLMYPAIALLGELSYPRVPTFGVPCPIVMLTVGFLMLTRPLPVALVIVPVLWTAIGGSAAFLLGMHADLALPLGGVALVAGLMPVTNRRNVAIRLQQ